jgi:hypothetical protein
VSRRSGVRPCAADELDETVLAIQDPPGAGKTCAGMIAAPVKHCKRVGVVARVIRKLLDEVNKADSSIRIGHKDDGKVTLSRRLWPDLATIRRRSRR